MADLAAPGLRAYGRHRLQVDQLAQVLREPGACGSGSSMSR